MLDPAPALRQRARLALGAVRHRFTIDVAALTLIVLASGLASSWNLGYAGYSTYYSTATRSMTISWRALAFGTFDPRGSITLDKLTGFLIPQALSARVFGFHPWAIALPQVIEGMVSVVAVFVIARRWLGRPAGVLAALAIATTPLLASMFGHVMEDGLLTMSLALALLCWQSAVLRGRLASLLLSAGWVAVGFQAKMMQAWLIVPGLAAGYLLAAPHPMAQRLRRGVLAGAVTVGLSLSWMTAIQLIPAADRPYIDGSTNNNAYSMVFGYNGFNRLVPNLIPGAIGDASPARVTTSRPRVTPSAPPERPVVQRRATSLPPGRRWYKLVLPYYATQVGWLYPAALAGLLLSIAGSIGGLRRRRAVSGSELSGPALVERASTATAIALGSWLVLAAAVLSAASVPHTAYFATISVQLALLATAGLSWAAERYRGPQVASRLVLPAVLLAQTAWTATVLWLHRAGPALLLPIVLLLGTAATVALLGQARSEGGRRPKLIIAAVLAVLVAPTVWTGYVLDRFDNGSAGEAYAGPRPASGQPARAGKPYQVAVPFGHPHDPQLTAAERNLVGYLRPRAGRTGPLLVIDQWLLASNFILKGGVNVMSMGGFSGRAPTPTLAQLQRLIGSGQLRFALLTVRDTLTVHNPTVQADRFWLTTHCVLVPAGQYGGPSISLRGTHLYACPAIASRPAR